MARTPRLRIGVDLGGTKIEGIAIAGDGREAARLRVPTPRGDYGATIRAIADVVDQLEARAGTNGTVGVGMPGALSPRTGLVKNANSTWLIGRPFDRDLAAALDREVRCANDANCLALSEATDGAGRDGRVVFGVILGTGVGGGLVVDRRVVSGGNAVAGEWGHNPLGWPERDETPGPACYCGRNGCLEVWLSGPGLARDHLLVSGEDRDAATVAAEARAGRPGAQATVRRYVSRLARGLAHVINVVDPDVVVLGGGLSNIGGLTAAVEPELATWVFGGEADTPVRPAAHGDSSGVRGAAWLW